MIKGTTAADETIDFDDDLDAAIVAWHQGVIGHISIQTDLNNVLSFTRQPDPQWEKGDLFIIKAMESTGCRTDQVTLSTWEKLDKKAVQVMDEIIEASYGE